jgi:hypothetical protein
MLNQHPLALRSFHPYVYSLLDAGSRLGYNDTAHAIAYRMLYGVIVLLVTVSCCVLRVNSPALVEGVLGREEAENSYFKPSYQPS